MFYNYKVLTVNNEEILYLYVNSIYEFSSELDNNNKQKSLLDKINNYINIMDINFSGKKVMLVVNGLIIASLTLVNNDVTYKEMIDVDNKDNVDIIDINTHSKELLKNKLNKNNDRYIISSFVKMKNKDGRTTYVNIDNYITNKLSSMIPATYEEEAIKSAAVIARTEAFRDLYENNYLDEDSYQSITTLQKIWNKNFNKYFNKLKNCVIDTDNQYLSSNNYYFNFDNRKNYRIPFSSYDANKLAKLGYTYLDILGHYYPDASLEII